jgi:hypothetical protein
MRFSIFVFQCALICVIPLGALAGRPTVSGNVARLDRSGVAHAPENAPQAVKNAIWAVNTLRKKPYRFGGGHGTFNDVGYDCSGTISFLLHYASCLENPTTSRALCSYGEPGPGRWITIYAKRGHVFAVVAGLRLDTTDFGNGREGPRWHADGRSLDEYQSRHPKGL